MSVSEDSVNKNLQRRALPAAIAAFLMRRRTGFNEKKQKAIDYLKRTDQQQQQEQQTARSKRSSANVSSEANLPDEGFLHMQSTLHPSKSYTTTELSTNETLSNRPGASGAESKTTPSSGLLVTAKINSVDSSSAQQTSTALNSLLATHNKAMNETDFLTEANIVTEAAQEISTSVTAVETPVLPFENSSSIQARSASVHSSRRHQLQSSMLGGQRDYPSWLTDGQGQESNSFPVAVGAQVGAPRPGDMAQQGSAVQEDLVAYEDDYDAVEPAEQTRNFFGGVRHPFEAGQPRVMKTFGQPRGQLERQKNWNRANLNPHAVSDPRWLRPKDPRSKSEDPRSNDYDLEDYSTSRTTSDGMAHGSEALINRFMGPSSNKNMNGSKLFGTQNKLNGSPKVTAKGLGPEAVMQPNEQQGLGSPNDYPIGAPHPYGMPPNGFEGSQPKLKWGSARGGFRQGPPPPRVNVFSPYIGACSGAKAFVQKNGRKRGPKLR